MSQEQTHIEVENELQRFMQLHGYKSLEEILKVPIEQLLKMEGFGFRILKEYFCEK